MGQRGQNRYSRVEPGQYVGQRDAHLHRPRTLIALGPPGQAHQAAKPLDHKIITRHIFQRTRLPETGNGAINKARIQFMQRFKIQAKFFQRAGAEVLYKDITL